MDGSSRALSTTTSFERTQKLMEKVRDGVKQLERSSQPNQEIISRLGKHLAKLDLAMGSLKNDYERFKASQNSTNDECYSYMSQSFTNLQEKVQSSVQTVFPEDISVLVMRDIEDAKKAFASYPETSPPTAPTQEKKGLSEADLEKLDFSEVKKHIHTLIGSANPIANKNAINHILEQLDLAVSVLKRRFQHAGATIAALEIEVNKCKKSLLSLVTEERLIEFGFSDYKNYIVSIIAKIKEESELKHRGTVIYLMNHLESFPRLMTMRFQHAGSSITTIKADIENCKNSVKDLMSENALKVLPIASQAPEKPKDSQGPLAPLNSMNLGYLSCPKVFHSRFDQFAEEYKDVQLILPDLIAKMKVLPDVIRYDSRCIDMIVELTNRMAQLHSHYEKSFSLKDGSSAIGAEYLKITGDFKKIIFMFADLVESLPKERAQKIAEMIDAKDGVYINLLKSLRHSKSRMEKLKLRIKELNQLFLNLKIDTTDSDVNQLSQAVCGDIIVLTSLIRNIDGWEGKHDLIYGKLFAQLSVKMDQLTQHCNGKNLPDDCVKLNTLLNQSCDEVTLLFWELLKNLTEARVAVIKQSLEGKAGSYVALLKKNLEGLGPWLGYFYKSLDGKVNQNANYLKKDMTTETLVEIAERFHGMEVEHFLFCGQALKPKSVVSNWWKSDNSVLTFLIRKRG